MISLKANADRKHRQMKAYWTRNLAERDRSIVALKVSICIIMCCMHTNLAQCILCNACCPLMQEELKHCNTLWMNKLAEKEKVLTSVKVIAHPILI